MLRQGFFAFGIFYALLPTSLATAPTTHGNPQGAQYIAVLPNDSPCSGSVIASSTIDGTGVGIQVSISGCPSAGGPFILDPSNEETANSCQQSKPAMCPAGDLAGKHGSMAGPNFAANYIDPFLSTIVGSPAFVGNRSLVILASNGTALACADFSMNGGSSPPQPAVGTAPPPIVTAGSAVSVVVSITSTITATSSPPSSEV
ncbi:Cell surface superoxide dismutase [Cu-Zn] 4 [Saxophila tyrrhenica]|uniref:Cell surface superoxide dismutase [Cu-Zn] 4 n=1 Tax=Saxophila tyrrhenica TaxID=1690608 RepID=A0AAV9P890_9PEZI|nr:Cell surface superoxide dismutase [Cu-Zn] 4 [Saxophila tyrrhenica]